MKKKKIKEFKVRWRNFWLMTRYPFLIPRNRWTGKKIRDFYKYTELDYAEVPHTWVPLILIPMLEPLKKILRKGHYLRKFRITQIKEKYGELCFYYNAVPVKIAKDLDKLIKEYSDKSRKICADCGQPSTCYSAGWVTYYCDDCRERYIMSGKKPGDFINL